MGKVLKSCFIELSPVCCDLFQWSLDTFTIPQLSKSSVVILVPKKSKPTVLSDYRTVALTVIIMKCFERIVMELLVSQTKAFIDPFQFAYRAEHSVEDAIYIFYTAFTAILSNPRHMLEHCLWIFLLLLTWSSLMFCLANWEERMLIQPHVLSGKLRGKNVDPASCSVWQTERDECKPLLDLMD